MKKIKKNLFVLMLCLAVMLVCSCQNGGGSDDPASGPSLVSVSFDIASDGPSYAVSVEGGRGTVSTVYYMATPKWTNDAYGKVTVWTAADSFSGSAGTLGLFAQGQWQFDIQVRSENGAVLYTGTNTAYINADDHALTFEVTAAFDATIKGTITVDVSANRVVASGDKLVITYGPTSNRVVDPETTPTINANPNGSSTATVADFDKQTISGLAAGMYWVKLEYKNGETVVGAATVDLTVDGGETAAISGTINYGEFQTTTLTINGLKTLTVSVVSNPAGSEVVKNTPVTFTCEATPSDDSSYQWYVNGVLQEEKTASTFVWTPSAAQYANISCSVVNGSIAASASKDFTVTD